MGTVLTSTTRQASDSLPPVLLQPHLLFQKVNAYDATKQDAPTICNMYESYALDTSNINLQKPSALSPKVSFWFICSLYNLRIKSQNDLQNMYECINVLMIIIIINKCGN